MGFVIIVYVVICTYCWRYKRIRFDINDGTFNRIDESHYIMPLVLNALAYTEYCRNVERGLFLTVKNATYEEPRYPQIITPPPPELENQDCKY
jgi:hypothetical protein